MKCPNCRKKVEFETASYQRTTRIAPVRFVVDVPARRCPACGAFIVTDAAAKEGELEIAAQIAGTGPVSAASFRLLRSAVRLRAVEVARLLGVTKETVSRWERGKRAVEPLAWKMLAWIVLEHRNGAATTRNRLESFLVAKPRKGTVHLVAPSLSTPGDEEEAEVSATAEEEHAYLVRDD